MARLALIATLALLTPAAAAAQGDRYGPDRTPRLRGSAAVTDAALLGWPGKGARRLAPPAAAPRTAAPSPPPQAPDFLPTQGPPNAKLPTSIYDPPPPPQAAAASSPRVRTNAPAPTAAAPAQGPLQPRRYSVGREFGVEPDRIRAPAPSVLAYAPEVAEAVLAQQERDRASIDAGPMSPADLDLLEQRQQEAERELARERARQRARSGR